MKNLFHLLPLSASLLLFANHSTAQWKTETYTLQGGWNAIYLQGDASYATPAELFADAPQVLEVWRWNPNPDATRFSTTPTVTDPTSSEWTVWVRDDPDEQTLSSMIGQSAYLILCSGTSATITTVSIRQMPQPPSATWLITGANLLGFPVNAEGDIPTFTTYFASFPVAIESPAKIYRYTGGDLSSVNPLQVTSPGTERISRNTAYWFEATTVGSFTGPVEYELPGASGIAFGRSGNFITMGIRNHTSSELTLTFSLNDSEPAPASQTQISGGVPLTYRTFDETTNQYTDHHVSGEFQISLPASGRVELQFGIDRSQLSGSSASSFASLLRVRDSSQFTDVWLPVSAQITAPDGLWIGEASVDSVQSTVAGSPGTTTARAFPLRLILHVDNLGETRLLSQVFVGQLAYTGNPQGICTSEETLWDDAKADALRIVASHMPHDRVITGSGSFATEQTLSFTITLPFDDPTNPFIHTYHPDHDNRDARFQPLPAGIESYDIIRECTFSFTAAPPEGQTITGWGTTVYGGTYTETIKGLNKTDLTVQGTFMLRRISEISTITID